MIRSTRTTPILSAQPSVSCWVLFAATFIVSPWAHGQADPASGGTVSGDSVSGGRGTESTPLQTTVERGPVHATVTLEPSRPKIGDTLLLTLTITAQPGVELVPVDNWDYLGRFVVVSTSRDESVNRENQSILSVEYQLESLLSGNYTIPPLLVEFLDRRPGRPATPDGEPSYELFTEEIEFAVERLTEEEIAQLELRGPMGSLPEVDLTDEESAKGPWWQQWRLALGGVSALLGLVLLGWLFSRIRRRVRRKTAFDVAWARLEQLAAKGNPSGAQVEAFYVELSALARRYLEDRFELRAPERTTEEFLIEVSESATLSLPHQSLLRDFLRTADLVKFAHFAPSPTQIEGALDSIRRFLEETRENAPLLDVHVSDANDLSKSPTASRALSSQPASTGAAKPKEGASR